MNVMTEGLPPFPPSQYRIALTVGDHSPRHLRRIARAYLCAWGVEAVADAVVLALTELTTNVHRHVPDRWCTVTLTRTLDGVRLEVYDRSPVVPAVRTPAPDALAECGRGLALVDLMTDKWDVSLHRVGKTVWCELHA